MQLETAGVRTIECARPTPSYVLATLDLFAPSPAAFGPAAQQFSAVSNQNDRIVAGQAWAEQKRLRSTGRRIQAIDETGTARDTGRRSVREDTRPPVRTGAARAEATPLSAPARSPTIQLQLATRCIGLSRYGEEQLHELRVLADEEPVRDESVDGAGRIELSRAGWADD
jgi:hypothetical protein